MRRSLLLAAFVALAAAAPLPQDEPAAESAPPTGPAGIIAIPAAIDLGRRLAESTADDRVWLVNTSDLPIRVERVKGTCGCLTFPDFEPGTLEPQEAIGVRFEMKVPALVGKTSTKAVQFLFDDQEPLSVDVTVEASNTERVIDLCDPQRGLNAAPTGLDLGRVAAGDSRNGEVWLINTADEPLDVVRAKVGCGCMKIASFAPVTLKPRQASRVPFSMSAPRVAGQSRTRCVYFATADGRSLPVPVRIEAR